MALLAFAVLVITGLFFEVLPLPFLFISTGKCSHSACRYIVVVCFYASACWIRKTISLRTNVVRKTEMYFPSEVKREHFIL